MAEKGSEGKGKTERRHRGDCYCGCGGEGRGDGRGPERRHGGGAESPLGDRGKRITKGLAEHVELWMRM